MELKRKDKLLIGFLGIVVLVALFGGQWWNNHKEFTVEKWAQYEGNSRQAIIVNFMNRTIIQGITKEALKEYLGEGEIETETQIAYFLGQPGFLGGVFVDEDSLNQYYVVSFEEGLGTVGEIIPETLLVKE